MVAKPAPPQPPRVTGDANADAQASQQWFQAFFSNAVRDTKLLDPAHQYDPGTFDPDNLRDPEEANLAHAQLTANEAYTKAQEGVAAAIPALEAAAAAQATADQGVTDAAAAQSTADTALANAATAQTTADGAVTDAAAAQATADTAAADATAAQSTADGAVTDAAAAQATADSALALATDANAHVPFIVGTISFGPADTSKSDTIATQPSTVYHPRVQVVAYTGTPPDGSFIVKKITNGLSDITVEIAAAPGGANTVTYRYLIFPDF